ncbi:MAG: hypothetical protein IJP92_02260, partial [Lachnospiraceae bacterium]|nr:hypothetical protein [Lachnospiraceae bacterium]
MTHTKILLIYIARIPSVQIVHRLVKDFAKVHPCELRAKSVSGVRQSDIQWADTVLSVRPYEDGSFKILRAARQAGRKTVLFLDD